MSFFMNAAMAYERALLNRERINASANALAQLRAASLLPTIFRKIEKEVNSGCFSCYYTFSKDDGLLVRNAICKALEDLGFTTRVSQNFHDATTTMAIMWSKNNSAS